MSRPSWITVTVDKPQFLPWLHLMRGVDRPCPRQMNQRSRGTLKSLSNSFPSSLCPCIPLIAIKFLWTFIPLHYTVVTSRFTSNCKLPAVLAFSQRPSCFKETPWKRFIHLLSEGNLNSFRDLGPIHFALKVRARMRTLKLLAPGFVISISPRYQQRSPRPHTLVREAQGGSIPISMSTDRTFH